EHAAHEDCKQEIALHRSVTVRLPIIPHIGRKFNLASSSRRKSASAERTTRLAEACGPRVERGGYPDRALRFWPHGALAQLGERRLCKPEVAGSIPARSTATPLSSSVSAQSAAGCNRELVRGGFVVDLERRVLDMEPLFEHLLQFAADRMAVVPLMDE
ncbi:MAG: hypothetical protein QOK13_1535, partial [Gaiellaceae bacterium]|nr:hypothetical protein [Gaiellaceae bacterium]